MLTVRNRQNLYSLSSPWFSCTFSVIGFSTLRRFTVFSSLNSLVEQQGGDLPEYPYPPILGASSQLPGGVGFAVMSAGVSPLPKLPTSRTPVGFSVAGRLWGLWTFDLQKSFLLIPHTDNCILQRLFCLLRRCLAAEGSPQFRLLSQVSGWGPLSCVVTGGSLEVGNVITTLH